MAITDKVRKILWAKSGNRCAICRELLVIERTSNDSESLVGEECHIISRSPEGPRHNPTLNAEHIDSIYNLVLLCRIHHKAVDDQTSTYSAESLKKLKSEHEIWVETKLAASEPHFSPKIRRFKDQIPAELLRITKGQDLLNYVAGCHGSYQNFPNDLSEIETEEIGSFLQCVQDWMDLFDGAETIEKVRLARLLTDSLNSLEALGFGVFVGQEKQRLEGGVGMPSAFLVLHITVARLDSPLISYKTQSPQPE